MCAWKSNVTHPSYSKIDSSGVLLRKELHMFIITPPWAYQRSYTTNRNAFERGS